MKSFIIGTEEEKNTLNGILAKNSSQLTEPDFQFLSNRMRRNVIEMVHLANSGHPGGPLGLADIYAVLYFKYLRVNLANPSDDSRDRVLLSNGHVCAIKYSAMAMRGFFPEEELGKFRKLGSRLQGHPSTRYFPEVENSSGSLGQGLSNACGLALGLRYRKNTAKVFVGLSDGECQEGMTWEAAMAASHYKLTNIHPFVDYNDIQIDGFTHDVMSLGDFAGKFESFGWLVKTSDGHDIKAIDNAFSWSLVNEGKPKIILFKTTLGKGVSFMENNPDWHGSPPNKEQRGNALRELGEQV